MVEFGFQLGNQELLRIRDLAQAADELGFDVIGFADHLIYEGPEHQMDPRTLVPDAIGVAAMAAAVTRRIRIGHLVLCNLFRHPAFTAQALSTLDNISGGRMFGGLGTGWTETEFRMMNMPFPPIGERLEMLDESIQCIKSLWSDERANFRGKHYQLSDAVLWPKPVQKRPPILLGGSGNGLMRIAAKHADYLNLIPPAGKVGKFSTENVRRMDDEAVQERVRFLRAETARVGRDPKAIKISNMIFMFSLTDTDAAARQMHEAIAPMMGMTADGFANSPLTFIGTPERCAAELTRRAKEWDIDQFIFSFQLGLDESVMRRIRDQVIPGVSAAP